MKKYIMLAMALLLIQSFFPLSIFIDQTETGGLQYLYADVQPEMVGESLLFFAVENPENVHGVINLLRMGIDPNIRDTSGKTPLIHAVKESAGQEIISALIDFGADINATDVNGKTALDYATEGLGLEESNIFYILERGSVDDLLLTLSLGIDSNWRDDFGNVPLVYAIRSGDVEKVSALIEAGVNIEARNSDGMTPLMYAAKEGSKEVLLELLMEAGADIEARSLMGMTPLMYAAAYGSEKMIIKLLEFGANPISSTESEVNALMFAALNSDSEQIIFHLIDAGTHIDSRDKNGATPLMYAASNNINPSIISTLLNAGADPGLQDDRGFTAFNYALGNEALHGTSQYWELHDAHYHAHQPSEYQKKAFLATARIQTINVNSIKSFGLHFSFQDPETPIETSVDSDVKPFSYWLVVAGVNSFKEAEEIAARLESHQLNTKIHVYGSQFEVRVGPYDSAEEAEYTASRVNVFSFINQPVRIKIELNP